MRLTDLGPLPLTLIASLVLAVVLPPSGPGRMQRSGRGDGEGGGRGDARGGGAAAGAGGLGAGWIAADAGSPRDPP